MKKIMNQILKSVVFFSGLLLMIYSCEKNVVGDVVFPVQEIYLPSALNGIFYINNVPATNGIVPTAGAAMPFQVDLIERKFSIPLGVYRAGVDNYGNIRINVFENTDTVDLLINSGILSDVSPLPQGKYTFDSEISIKDEQEIGSLGLYIDLDYLNSFADSAFALALAITSQDAKVSAAYHTCILVIDTKLFTPEAGFSFKQLNADKSFVQFANESVYSNSWLWDFGDETSDTTLNPLHQYAASGTYRVSLKAVGVMGEENPSILTQDLKLVIKPKASFTYGIDPGNPKLATFKNESTGAVAYQWNFGDGTAISEEENPTHEYSAAGEYEVNLTAIGDQGHDSKKNLVVTIK